VGSSPAGRANIDTSDPECHFGVACCFEQNAGSVRRGRAGSRRRADGAWRPSRERGARGEGLGARGGRGRFISSLHVPPSFPLDVARKDTDRHFGPIRQVIARLQGIARPPGSRQRLTPTGAGVRSPAGLHAALSAASSSRNRARADAGRADGWAAGLGRRERADGWATGRATRAGGRAAELGRMRGERRRSGRAASSGAGYGAKRRQM
jgi:hypothetical protein